MALDLMFGKLVLLGVLMLNLFYFLTVQFRKNRKTVLIGVMISLLILSTLLSIISEYISPDVLTFLIHFFGVFCIGVTSMMMAISSSVRMKRVMKRELKLATRN